MGTSTSPRVPGRPTAADRQRLAPPDYAGAQRELPASPPAPVGIAEVGPSRASRPEHVTASPERPAASSAVTASAFGAEAQATPASVGAEPSRPASILIVDDERRIRLAIRSCLEAEGYAVLEAADGNQALDMVLQHAPDLMILDLAMPNLDGMRTLRELQSLHGQLKPRVVMLTAFGSMPAAASAISLGAAAFLEKPLIPETLRQLVARVLAEPPEVEEEGQGIPVEWPGDEN